MGLIHSPRIVTDGLVLCLDAGNTKGYDKFENLLRYSEDFSNNSWIKQNGFSITSNTAIAPDGTLTADTASRVNLSSEYLYQAYGGTGTFTLSCWVRAVTGTTTFVMSSYNGVDGSIASQTFTATTTWQRFSHTATVTTTNSWYPCIPSVSGAQLYIWGAQLERGSSVNDYYATTSTAKTRGTSWGDLSGNGNNGTLTNGPTYSSSNGGSIVFDGTNDYIVRNPTTIDLSAGVTMEMIFKSTDMNSRAQGFMQYNASGGYYINFYTPGNGRLRWETWVPVSVAGGAFYTPTALSNNTWYHAVGTYSSGSSKLYINGINVSSASQTSGTYSSSYTGNLQIGQYAGYMSGNVAIAKIYNRVLTAEEIQQNFNALRSRFGI